MRHLSAPDINPEPLSPGIEAELKATDGDIRTVYIEPEATDDAA